MRLFLASPHTFLKFRGGNKLAIQALGGIFSNEDIPRGEYDISAVRRPEPDRGGL